MDCRVRPGNDEDVAPPPSPNFVIPGLDPGIHAAVPRLRG